MVWPDSDNNKTTPKTIKIKEETSMCHQQVYNVFYSVGYIVPRYEREPLPENSELDNNLGGAY